MRLIFIIIFVTAFLSGCIHYSEEWHFNQNGSGSIQIICEPSPSWIEHAAATNWFQAALLFIPPYKSISQDFARAGVKIVHCKFTTQKGKPKIDMLVNFDSLSSIARTSLFSDRRLQWRKKLYSVTLLHHLSTKRPLGKAELASLDDGVLSDAKFDLKMFFPGRVIKVNGAQKKGNCVFINANLKNLAMGNPITITATARIAYPLWFKLLIAFIIVLLLTIIILFIIKKFFLNSQNANSSFNSQPL